MRFDPSILLALLLISSCGGGDDDSSAGPSRDKRLGELTQAELLELCDAENAAAPVDDDVRRGLCVFGAASESDPMECETSLAECLSREKKPRGCPTKTYTFSCQVTVAEYLTCYATVVDAYAALGTRTCEQVAGRALELAEEIQTLSDECSPKLDGCTESDF